MSRRRGQVRGTRSSREYGGKTVYYCTGGAGGHSPVTVERGSAPATLRCPVCGLTKPVNYKRRRVIKDAGLTEVDISALPF